MQPPVDTKEAEALPVKPAPVTKAVTPSVLAAGTKAVDLEVPPANGNVQKTTPLTQPSVKEPAENPSTPASVSESSTSRSSEAIEPKPDEDPAKSKLNAAALAALHGANTCDQLESQPGLKGLGKEGGSDEAASRDPTMSDKLAKLRHGHLNRFLRSVKSWDLSFSTCIDIASLIVGFMTSVKFGRSQHTFADQDSSDECQSKPGPQ